MSVGGATGLPEKIGKYRVVDRIGRGGMGMIFKAHDPILDRQVALKVISPEVEVTDELRTRFFREAQACAKLNHPNIVTIYDMGEDNGRLFIVMELLEGEELRRLIAQRTALTLEEKLSVMLQVCGGLHYAHQKGIVHRDMKPGNIFRLKNGQVKILDFGIAHIASTEAGLTRTGLIMGTLRYISPEQVRGRADHRSDMFSVGSVFYELLTSRPPFLGDDPMQLLEQLRTEDPPSPTDIDPVIPAELAVIVLRAIRKNPTDRFHDLEEMRSELELVHGGLIEERQRVLVRVRRQRERIVQLRAALAERIGAPADEEPIRPITERNGLVTAQATEREFAGLIETLEAKIAQADSLAPTVQRANELLNAGRFEDALEQFETILTEMPEHQPAREGLARARAEADANRQRDRITDVLQKARAALDDRRYALCLENLKQATSIPLPADATEAITALREAAEAGLVEQQTLRLARQQADEARAQMVQARTDAQGEEAAQFAPGAWNEAETAAAAADAELRRSAFVEAKKGFDQAAAIYRRSLDAARQAQVEERRTAERARDMAKQGQNQARSVGATQYASDLWDAAESRFAEAQAVYGQKPSARVRAAFTEASALYRRAEEAAREARERERRRADAARDRAAEGRRSASTMGAEHRASAVWEEAVGKSAEGEAAFLRQQYAKTTEAFEAALELYHRAQAQVREVTRRQREEAQKKQQAMAERRRSATAVEAASHAASDWTEAETSAAAGDSALAREAWEDATRAFDQAATLYQRAEEHSRETLRARADAERAVEATGLARRTAAEAQAGTYAPEALKKAEGAEARAVAALSRQQFVTARPLLDDAARLYTAAARAAAAHAEARRLEAAVTDAGRLLESGDANACLERVNEILRLRPGHAGAEALRARAQEALRHAEEAARLAEAVRQAEAARQAEATKRAKEAADAGKTTRRGSERARPVPPPSTAAVNEPAERDDATTVLLRPSEMVKPPSVSADRDDATIVISVTPTAAPTGQLPAQLRIEEARSAEVVPVPTAAEGPPARLWRFGVRTAVGLGVGAAAVVVFVVVSWRSQPLRPPVEDWKMTAAPPITAAPVPRSAPIPQPSKPPVSREPAELVGKSSPGPGKEPTVELPPKTQETRPTPVRKEAELRVLESRVAEARRTAVAAEAPKLAGSLWAKADAAQRRAEDALKQEDGDRAERLFGDAQKAYQDAERTARAAAADARKRALEEAEQARATAARAQQEETNQRVAAAERGRVAAVQRQQAEAEQARGQMLAARRAAEQAGADHHSAKLLEAAQSKERDGQTALARSDYDAAGRLFREASSDYQNATQQAIRETEMERRQLAMLKSSAEQSKSKAANRREEAVKVEAERLAKPVFDAAQAKQTEAERLATGQHFAGANQAYQDAADRYMEASMRAQMVRDLRGQADAVRARMLAQKQKARQDSSDFRTALSEERQAASLYDQLNFKEAADKFRAAEMLFIRAAMPPKETPPPQPLPPAPPLKRQPPPPF